MRLFALNCLFAARLELSVRLGLLFALDCLSVCLELTLGSTGALDCRATCINEEMKIACTNAIAELARTKDGWLEDTACPDFGRDYILPKPFDKRILLHVAPAVAKAAADSGCARQPLDNSEYIARLQHQVW